LVELLGKLSGSRRASFLAVLKTFGRGGDGLLSFPRPGHTLALDLPAAPGIVEFARDLDRVVLKHGGRVYLAKDACLTREAFEQMYPNLGRFKEAKARLDPEGRFTSSLARRLGIAPVEGA
jgi:FAD/FMN-containing dehydrogenase